jgi:hypothetical protein
MNRIALIVFSFFIVNVSFAQIDTAEVYRQLFGEEFSTDNESTDEESVVENNSPYDEVEEEEEEDEGGIPVYVALQPAVYFANNAMANYFNGSVKEIIYENTYVIQTIWDNPNNKKLIKDDMNLTDNQYDGVFFNESNFNYEMRYNIGLMIGFQAFFALKQRFQVMVDFNFVSLNTASVITLYIPDLNTPNDLVRYMDVYGKEQRFIIDLGVHGILGKKDLKYYLEGGPNFLMAKATDNYFITGDPDDQSSTHHNWSLKRTTNNTAANTITSFTLGVYAGAGMFFKMNEDFAFEFGGQMGLNSMNFPGYGGYFPNFQINLRIIYLSKNSEL